MLSAAKDESVPLLAASSLSENSRPGFGGCDSELRQVIELANALNASGLGNSLYDDRIGSRATGKERDSESGLDYFGARYYGSALGRFTSPDWSAKPESVPYADFSNPQTLNRYAYVLNNPLSKFDPDGHEEALWKKWLNAIEVKVSASAGTGGSVQLGKVGFKAEMTFAKAEAKIGLGGGNGDVKVESGVKFTATAGPAEASAKIGVEASAQNGVGGGLSAGAKVSGTGLNAGVKIDQSGMQATAGTVEQKSDFVIGGDFKFGVGIGASVNFSQFGRAWDSTVETAGQAYQTIKETVSWTGQSVPSLTPALDIRTSGNQE